MQNVAQIMENVGKCVSVSERPEAVKCSNFLGGHFVFLKCCEFCTEAIEMHGANMFSGGCTLKTTAFCTVICILQFREYFSTFG